MQKESLLSEQSDRAAGAVSNFPRFFAYFFID